MLESARKAAARQPLCSDIGGFSLHAGVRVAAHDRGLLEQLCRYITRPALSDEPVQLNAADQVKLKLKTLWRDGTTHLVMSLQDFMQRRAALAPGLPVADSLCPGQATASQRPIQGSECRLRVVCWRTSTAGDRHPKSCN